MSSQKKLLSEQVMPKTVLDENAKALEFYKTYKEISDISEKIDIAMGRKQTYKYSSGSTKNCEINHHAITPTTKSYSMNLLY